MAAVTTASVTKASGAAGAAGAGKVGKEPADGPQKAGTIAGAVALSIGGGAALNPGQAIEGAARVAAAVAPAMPAGPVIGEGAAVAEFLRRVQEGQWKTAQAYFEQHRVVLQSANALATITRTLLDRPFFDCDLPQYFNRLGFAVKMGALTPQGSAKYFMERLSKDVDAARRFYYGDHGQAELNQFRNSPGFRNSITKDLVSGNNEDHIGFALEFRIMNDEVDEDGVHGRVPVLVYAAAKKCDAAFSILLRRVENLEAAHPVSRRTALHILSGNGQVDLCNSFMARCFEISAAYHNQIVVAEDSQGKKAADLAYSRGDKRVLEKLCDVYGALTPDLLENIIRDGAVERFDQIVRLYNSKKWQLPITERVIESAMNKRRFIRELIPHLSEQQLTQRRGASQQTLLHHFAQNGDPKSVQLLLAKAKEMGDHVLANVISIQDVSGKTPSQVAAKENNKKVLDAMMNHLDGAHLGQALAVAPNGTFDRHTAYNLLRLEIAGRLVNPNHVIPRANPLPAPAPIPPVYLVPARVQQRVENMRGRIEELRAQQQQMQDVIFDQRVGEPARVQAAVAQAQAEANARAERSSAEMRAEFARLREELRAEVVRAVDEAKAPLVAEIAALKSRLEDDVVRVEQ